MKAYQHVLMVSGVLFLLNGCAFEGTQKGLQELKKSALETRKTCALTAQIHYSKPVNEGKKHSKHIDTLLSNEVCVKDNSGKWIPTKPGQFYLYNVNTKKVAYKFYESVFCEETEGKGKNAICKWNGNLRSKIPFSIRFSSKNTKHIKDHLNWATLHFSDKVVQYDIAGKCEDKLTCSINLFKVDFIGRYPSISDWRIDYRKLDYAEYLSAIQNKLSQQKKAMNRQKKTVATIIGSISKSYNPTLHKELTCYAQIVNNISNVLVNTQATKIEDDCKKTTTYADYAQQSAYWSTDGAKATSPTQAIDAQLNANFLAIKADISIKLNDIDETLPNRINLIKQVVAILDAKAPWHTQLNALILFAAPHDALKFIKKAGEPLLKLRKAANAVDALHKTTIGVQKLILTEKEELAKSTERKHQLIVAVIKETIPNQKQAFQTKHPIPSVAEGSVYQMGGLFIDRFQLFSLIAWNAVSFGPTNKQLKEEVSIANAIPIVDLIGGRWQFYPSWLSNTPWLIDIRVAPLGIGFLYETYANTPDMNEAEEKSIINPVVVSSFGISSLRLGIGWALFCNSELNISNAKEGLRLMVGIDLFKLFTNESTGTSISENTAPLF